MRKFNEQEFIKALEKAKSWTDISRTLSVSHNGARGRTYKKLCNKLNLDYSHLLGQAWSRGLKLKRSETIDDYNDVFCKNSSYKGGTKGLKLIILKLELIEYVCECGNTGEWLGKNLSLQLDHKDGDNKNDEINNLRFLCPNCHSQTDTYAGKNIK